MDNVAVALKQADAVIALMTSYLDDLLARARAVNAPHKARVDAGPFALYAERRLDELVARVAALSRDAVAEPLFCPGCGNFTLGRDGMCRRERCSYGKKDEDDGQS